MSQTEAMAKAFSERFAEDDQHRDGRSDLFKRIQKRDGMIVDFQKSKIADAIFKAAQSVGGRDRRLSDELADRVILYLRNRFEANLLNIEDVQDAVEKILIENGHARTVKAYILYRQERSRVRQLQSGKLDAADLRDIDDEGPGNAEVQVETSADRIVRWNRERIVNALVRETSISRKIARKIAQDIERQIVYAKIHRVTAALIRELVNAKLVEFGFEDERRLHTRLGVPRYDAERLLLSAETTHKSTTPAQSEAFLTSAISKQFAATRVLPKDVVDAHLSGEIHVHGMDRINRLDNFLLSPEYIKKFGALGQDGSPITAPPTDYNSLLDALVASLTILSMHTGGRVGLDAVNVLLAPEIAGRSEFERDQLAGDLIGRLVSETRRPGSHPLFLDLHLFWNVPQRLRDLPAEPLGDGASTEAYGYYELEARKFALSLLRACDAHSSRGFPLPGIRPVVHLEEHALTDGSADELLNASIQSIGLWGGPSFAVDRDKDTRLAPFGVWETAGQNALPWKVRGATVQTVTLNLPRAAYMAGGSDDKLHEHLSDALNTALKAHMAKHEFLDRLLGAGEDGPYQMLLARRDGESFLRPGTLRFGIGVVGLMEMAEIHLRQPFDSSSAPLKFILEVLAKLHLECKRYSARNGVSYVLTSNREIGVAARLAALDHETLFGGKTLNDNEATIPQRIVYSCGLPPYAPDDGAFLRTKHEGKYHRVVEGLISTNAHLNGKAFDATDLTSMLGRVIQETRNVEIQFSPEWTVCRDCSHVQPGIADYCASCHSSRVTRVTRADDFYRAFNRPVPPLAESVIRQLAG